MENKIYNGVITRIVPNKSFGNIIYVDHEETLSISFCSLSNPPEHKKWNWLYGDEVKFTIEQSESNPEQKFAKIIEYVGNAQLDRLHEIVQNQGTISGYVKKFENQYFLKEVNTNIRLRFKVSDIQVPPEPESLITVGTENVNLSRIRTMFRYCLHVPMEYSAVHKYNMEILQTIGKDTVKGHVTEISDSQIFVKLDDYELEGSISVRERSKLNEWTVGETIFVWVVDIKDTKNTGRIHFDTIL